MQNKVATAQRKSDGLKNVSSNHRPVLWIVENAEAAVCLQLPVASQEFTAVLDVTPIGIPCQQTMNSAIDA
jgi:hypothetical protein